MSILVANNMRRAAAAKHLVTVYGMATNAALGVLNTVRKQGRLELPGQRVTVNATPADDGSWQYCISQLIG